MRKRRKHRTGRPSIRPDAGGQADQQADAKRPSFQIESVERRILLSATWVDAETGDPLDGPTSGNDIYTGTEGDDIADALAGNDVLSGLGGDDVLAGGAGDDLLDGGAGDDTLHGGTGDDSLIGGEGLDIADYSGAGSAVSVDLSAGTANGGDGADMLSGIENVVGSDHDDTLSGDDADNVLSGGVGDDTLTGGLGDDTLAGGAGSDTADYSQAGAGVSVDLAAGSASGGAGNDTLSGIEDVTGSDYSDVLAGDAADNVLAGGSGDDSLDGGAGDDTLNGGLGDDTLDGGAGIDLVDYTDAGSAVSVNLQAGTATGGEGSDAISNIENVAGSAYDDTLIGDGADNVLSGGAGDDTIGGGAGDDTLSGGTGVDTADYSAANSAVNVNLETGAASGGDGNDTLIGFENMIGSMHDDTLTGDIGDNVLTGGAGDDVLIGGAGDDTLEGGAGSDTADYSAANGAVSVDLTSGVALGDGNDSLSGIENVVGSANDDTLTGDANDNLLAGGGGNDALAGGAGSDTLTGGAGDDTLHGGAGDDTLVGGAGIDTADYGGAASGVNVDLAAGTASGGAGNDTLSEIENVAGSDHADTLSGDAGDNVLTGGAGDDTLIGGGGNDTLDGGLGDDVFRFTGAQAGDVYTVAGEAGTDTIDLSEFNGSQITDDGSTITVDLGGGQSFTINYSGVENIIGADQDDTLTGSVGDNTLIGGGGGDTFNAGTGNDTYDGGTGTDTVDYSGVGSGVDVNLESGSASGAGNDTLSGIENVVGSEQSDTLTGDAGDNVLSAGAGNDTVQGGAGDDTLDGGAGTDTVDYSGAAGAVQVDLTAGTGTGGDGNDTLSGFENITGSDHDDTLTGDDNANVIAGGAGNDVIDAGAGDDTLVGGAGDDTLEGGAGQDTADYSDANAAVQVDLEAGTAAGGAGNDSLSNIEDVTGSAFDDTLTGDNKANVLAGGAGADTLDGGVGNDTLQGGSGDDTLDGGIGNDVLEGGIGDDTLSGGTGSDTADYSAAVSGVDVNLVTGTASGGAGSDTLSSIENVLGSAHADTLTANEGGSVLSGAAGDDTLIGGVGNDTLDGGAGIDTADYSDIGSAVSVDLGSGSATGGAGHDSLTNIENVTGSAHDDTLVGDAGANVLTGGAGDDLIDGGAGVDTADYSGADASVTVDLAAGTATGGDGNDLLSNIENIAGSDYDDSLTGDGADNVILAGGGNDTLIGGAGDDTLDGGAGVDTVDYSGAASAVNVDLEAGNASGEGEDTLSNIENVLGSAQDDTLAGDSADNVLSGGAGDDTLHGGAGDDTLVGGAGIDTADYGGAASGVNVDLAAGTASGGAGNDTLSEIENVAGSDHADTLSGDAGDNVLTGGAGDDTLIGGGGNDTLDGGLGDDVFRFTGAQAGDVYTVAGEAGTDTIDLSEFNGSQITDDGSTITVDLGGGQSFTINYSGVENIIGADQDDTLTGSVGDNTLIGGGGGDTFNAGTGNDTYDGGTGTDTVDYSGVGSGVDVNLESGSASGAGNDTLSGIENVVGSEQSDTLTGDAGDNVLSAGAGNDTVQGGAGDDTLDGGAGTDTVDYSGAAGAVQVDLTAGTGTGGDGNDTLSGFENITGSDHDDTLTGDDNANVIAGGAGNDVIDAGAGDDTLVGGAGDDTLEGGAGQDTADYSDANAAVQVDLEAGTAAGGAGNDTLSNIENVAGSAHGDTLTGDAGDNVLSGGQGDDVLAGGAGDDVLQGDAGTDTADYSDAAAGVNVNLAAGTASGGAGNDTLSSVENVTGSEHDDVLTGDSGSNVLSGGGGDDLLTGGAGNDTLEGGAGTDTADYSAAGSGIDVNLAAGMASGGAGSDTLSSIENVLGSEHADTLTGDADDNVLSGGAGDDLLVGGGGNDTLIGGDGDDTFKVTGAQAGDVYTVDGGPGSNTLDLSEYSTSQVEDDGATITVHLAGGQSFTIHYTNIDNVVTSNVAPTVVDNQVDLAEDASLTIQLGATDPDLYDTIEQYRIESLPANGTLEINGDPVGVGDVITPTQIASGQLTFEPNPDWNGSTGFEFSAFDGQEWSNGSGTYSITVSAVNDAPTAGPGGVTTDEDTSVAVVLNGSDIDAGDQIEQYRLDSLPEHGTLLLNGQPVGAGDVLTQAQIDSGELTFQPDEHWHGTTTLEFSTSDGEAWSDSSATLTINVSAVNDAPTAGPGSVTTDEDTSVAVVLNGSDIDAGDQIEQYRLESLPEHGTLLLNGQPVRAGNIVTQAQITDEQLTFRPDANWNGSTSLTFHTHDGEVWSADAARFSIDVEAVNDAPRAQAGFVTVAEDQPASIRLSGSDPDAGEVIDRYRIESLPEDGALKLDGEQVRPGDVISQAQIDNGTLTFEPSENWNGVATFTFSAGDEATWSEQPATFSIEVEAVNDAPVAEGDSVETAEDTPALIPLSGNDIDTGDQIELYRVDTLPEHGTLLLNDIPLGVGDTITQAQIDNGELWFGPDPNWHGSTSLDFSAFDGDMWSAEPASIEINITPGEDTSEPDPVSEPVDTEEEVAPDEPADEPPADVIEINPPAFEPEVKDVGAPDSVNRDDGEGTKGSFASPVSESAVWQEEDFEALRAANASEQDSAPESVFQYALADTGFSPDEPVWEEVELDLDFVSPATVEIPQELANQSFDEVFVKTEDMVTPSIELPLASDGGVSAGGSEVSPAVEAAVATAGHEGLATAPANSSGFVPTIWGLLRSCFGTHKQRYDGDSGTEQSPGVKQSQRRDDGRHR